MFGSAGKTPAANGAGFRGRDGDDEEEDEEDEAMLAAFRKDAISLDQVSDSHLTPEPMSTPRWV